ncbi:protein kinase, partial [Myxococcota bacterium]|nr:protein kinase [Myxococcota bacterium]
MEKLVQGKLLGRFVLERRLAVGGMAEIWLAHDPSLASHPELALKILLAPFAKDPGARAMFFDEVNIASRLEHPNIVRVYEAFEADGHLVQAMELVDGRDLRRVLSSVARAGQFVPIPIALRIGREIARALDYAHTKESDDGKPLGIIHRDVSPHNVMITRDGVVKVLDFGIARAAERITRTRTGVIKGKLSYMAPEQALAVSISQRSDIFSTGILLWEMLAMQRLFKAESDTEIMQRVIEADVPPIHAYNPEVPQEVAVLLGQMLSKRESMRPESMRVVDATLSRILARWDERTGGGEALATWVLPFLDEGERRTGRLQTPDVAAIAPSPAREPTGTPVMEADDGAELGAADRTLTMGPADPRGASGAHPLPVVLSAPDVRVPTAELPPPSSSESMPLVRVADPSGGVAAPREHVRTDKVEIPVSTGDQTLLDVDGDDAVENASLDPTAKLDAPSREQLGLKTAPVRTRTVRPDAVATLALELPPGVAPVPSVAPRPPAPTS